MKAVILAAGKGTRMRPLTLTTPKPLLEVAGIPLIEHIANTFPDEITDIVVVVGYLGDLIKKRYPEILAGRPVTYIEQSEQTGTASALLLARPYLTGKFLVILGDDLHSSEGIKEALTYENAVIAYRHDDPSKFGVIVPSANGTLETLVEKPDVPPSNLISTGAMVLDERIFDYPAILHQKGEYFIPDMVTQLAKNVPVQIVVTPFWFPVGTPEELRAANELHITRARGRA